MQNYETICTKCGRPTFTPDSRDLISNACRCYEEAVEVHTASPHTVVVEKLYLDNLLVTVRNLIGVIGHAQWERLASKTWSLQDALAKLEKSMEDNAHKTYGG